MKKRILQACQKVTRNMLLSMIQHYIFWLQRCIDVQGNVFEH